MYNTEKEINSLAESLKKSRDIEGVLESLYFVLENHTPFGLYIATSDRSNCMWLFDPNTLYDMLGGEDIHGKTFRSIFIDQEEKEKGILFYVLKKVGPLVVIRLSHDTILNLIGILERSNHP